MNRQQTQLSRETQLTAAFKLVVIGVIALTILACGTAGPRPLSIKMFNAETNTTLNCEARDLGMADRNMLANTVESCARQLESRGFVRASSTP